MARGIKQKLLKYHIAKRDGIQGQIKRSAVSTEVREQYQFHADAVEFLSKGE